ncbi:cytochrome P450 [Trametes maxima]|nr:cytochrome P450 [Trametes maxima]
MLQYAVLLCVTYVVWKITNVALARKSPLDNIDGPPSQSWLTGHLLQLYDKQGWDFHHDLQTKYGPVSRLQSIFGKPMLCVWDPLAMNTIVLKEQSIFEEMDWFMDMGLDSFGPGLISTTGVMHKRQRKLISPVFSSKNLRRVTPVFYGVAKRLKQAILNMAVSGAHEIDVARYMGRTALEIAGQATLGHSFDPLTEDRHDPYALALKSFIPALSALSNYFQLYAFLRPLLPPAWRRTLMNLLPSRRVKSFLQIIDTLHSNAAEIYTEKKGLVKAQGQTDDDAGAGDLITILLRANANAAAEDTVPEDELIAQLSILLFAATDTTSNAITLILERLAENLGVQEKLREEVCTTKRRYESEDVPYDELMSLPYLDAVCRETLRVSVPAQLRIREARADCVLPLSKPIRGKDGEMINSVYVPKGTLVFVGVQASNVNKELWGEDAPEWRPERWLQPLPDAVVHARIPGIYANLMTFWGGGRSCPGVKFAQLEMKVVLYELLTTFRFEKTGAPVMWNLGEVIHPTVGADSLHPGYPMKVTLVNC